MYRICSKSGFGEGIVFEEGLMEKFVLLYSWESHCGNCLFFDEVAIVVRGWSLLVTRW
jgi:hypothetical protein